MAGVVDHLQGPTVAGAGLLGGRQRHDPVMPPPDERCRHLDAGQLLGRDLAQPELAQQAAVGLPHAGVARQLQRVGPERRPALPHPPPRALGVDRHLPQHRHGGAFARPDAVADQGQHRGRWDPHLADQAAHADQHQPGEAVAAAGREPGGDGAAQRGPDQHRRGRAGPLDELAEPGQRGRGAGRSHVGPRGAEARQVGRDDMVRPHQLRHDRHPHARPAPLPVQQHHRRAFPALQHGGGHPGQLQPAFGDRGAGQQPPPEVVARDTTTTALDDPLPAHRRPSSAADLASGVIVGDGTTAAKDRL